MTIPVIPGPFSFIQELGRGVGTAFQVAENQKRTLRAQAQEDRAEALKQVGVIFDAVQNNQMTANTLKSPFFLDLIKRSGIADSFGAPDVAAGVAPKPEDTIRGGQSEYLQSLLANRTPGNEGEIKQTLATGRVQAPSEVAKGKEETLASGARATTIEGGGAAGRAQAGVIAEPVAVAGEEASRDKFYNSVADRSVGSALTRSGGNILKTDLKGLADSAWQTAQQDARSRGYVADESLTRPYIEAAIASQYREALTEEAKVRAAQARGTDTYDDYLRILQNNQGLIRQQISALPKPSEQALTYARAYEAQLARQRSPEEQRAFEQNPSTAFLRSAYDQVQAYNTQLDRLNRELNGNRDELNNALAGKIPSVGGAIAGRAAEALSEKQIDDYAAMLKAGTGTEEQLDQAVTQGAMSSADAAKIKERAKKGAAAR